MKNLKMIKLNCKVIITLILISILFMLNNVFGASLSITSNNRDLTVGDTATITIKANNVAGKVTISNSSGSVGSINKTSAYLDNDSTTIVFSSKKAGSTTITVTPVDMTDYDSLKEYKSSSSITINVKNVEVKPTPTPEPTKPTYQKSSDNYLSSLRVGMEGLSPAFNKNINTYYLTVGNDVDKLNLRFSLSHSKATSSLVGNSGFVVGKNTVSITVKSESGYNRVYTILVTKEDIKDNVNSILDNLVIEDYSFTEGFKSDIFEYNLGEISIDKLNILAYPKIEGAKVEIIGNDILVDGENTIKIKVTSLNGESISEYLIKFINKLPKKEIEENNKDDVDIYGILALKNTKNNDDNKFLTNLSTWFGYNGLYLLLMLCIIFEFIQIVYLYLKLNKKYDIINKNKKINLDILENVNKMVVKDNDDINYNYNNDSDYNDDNKCEVIESIKVEDSVKDVLGSNIKVKNIFEDFAKENIKKEKNLDIENIENT